MMDENRIMEGRPGYGNEAVRAGDRLLQIDGIAVSSTSTVDFVHQLLAGPLYTAVELHFVRSEGPGQRIYSIRVLRHN